MVYQAADTLADTARYAASGRTLSGALEATETDISVEGPKPEAINLEAIGIGRYRRRPLANWYIMEVDVLLVRAWEMSRTSRPSHSCLKWKFSALEDTHTVVTVFVPQQVNSTAQVLRRTSHGHCLLFL
jgi:hypothetical protein